MSAEMEFVLELLAAAPRDLDRSPEERRLEMDALAGSSPLVEDTVVEPVVAGGVPAVWVRAPGAVDDGALLYLHGGGYVVGSTVSHRPLASRLSAASGLPVLLLDYRLAPEHVFPAAVEDAVTAVDWLLDQGLAADRIAVAGDSAGGGLTLATLIARRDAGVALPGAAACLSPWTDLTMDTPSMDANAATDPMLDREGLQQYADWYLGDGGDATAPTASPRFGDLSGLPPVLLHAAATEVLADDARLVAEAIEAAGGEVEHRTWPGCFHVWHATAGMTPEGDEAVADIGRFLTEKLA